MPGTIENPPTNTGNPLHTGVSEWMNSLPSLETGEPAKPAAIAPSEPAPPANPNPAAPEKPTPATPDPNPPPTKPADPAPEPKDEEEKWPRSAQDWEKFKAKRAANEKKYQEQIAALSQEREKLAKELEAAKQQPAGNPAEVETLKKEMSELSDRLQQVAVEKHPKFVAYFEGKRKEYANLAQTVVGADKAAELTRILSMGDDTARTNAMEEFSAEFSPLKQAQIAHIATRWAETEAYRASELSRYKDIYQQLAKEGEKTAQTRQQQQQQALTQAITDALAKAQAKDGGVAPFQPKENDAAWNAEVSKRVEAVKQRFAGNITPNEIAQIVVHATAFPVMQDLLSSKDKEIAQLQDTIKSLQAANPGLPAGQKPGGIPGPEPTQRRAGQGTDNPMDATAEWMKGFQTAMNS